MSRSNIKHSTSSFTLCALTSHHRVRCSSGLKQLAKHHQHVTYTPCKAPKKAVEGATALLSVRPYVNNSDLQNLDSLEIFFRRVRPIVRRLRSVRLKRSEVYPDFAKLKRILRSFRLKCFKVYVNFVKLSTLMRVKFVAAKQSSQSLRGGGVC